MKHIFSALMVCVLTSLPVKANEDVRGVISAQIEAFLADDFETAFTYASPMIKQIFRTPERFGEMVRNGYPMVWRPSGVEFLSSEERDSALWQTVLVRDAQGVPFLLEYEMIETENGWMINGVRVLPAEDGMA